MQEEKVKFNTWDDLAKQYPMDRDSMNREQERQYVEACYCLYEAEGFAECFISPYEEYAKDNGKKFKVLRRCTEDDWDLCSLPAWDIEFEDGTQSSAYPEEIITKWQKA